MLRLTLNATMAMVRNRNAVITKIPGMEPDMLRWTLIFLVVAIVAAVFGFGGIAAASAGIARILFFIFLILFIVSLLGGLMRRA